MRHPIRGDWDALCQDGDRVFSRHLPGVSRHAATHADLARGLVAGDRRIRRRRRLKTLALVVSMAVVFVCVWALLGPIQIDFVRAIQ